MNFQEYLNPTIEPISAEKQAALDQSPLSSDAFIPFESVSELVNSGYFEVENGYCLNSDGSASIAVLTDMPNVTPAMWHWWFGWHGDSDDKYKLWHPQAHVSVQWKDKVVGQVAYMDRVSHVCEYIGSKEEKDAIQFKNPATIGLSLFELQNSDAVYIVARIGMITIPVDLGWLVHQVRKTPTGSEMRSRFWIGGAHFDGRNVVGNLIAVLLHRIRKIQA